MAGNRYAAAYHALYECIRSLIVIRDLARLEPTADMVSHVTSLHDMLWKGRDALAVELNHVLPALTTISASPVEICGETGTCVHDAVFRLADATLMNLLAAGGNAETASWGLGPDNWGRLREAVAHLDPTELKRAEVEARREALRAEVQGRITPSGHGTTMPANPEKKGNCVTGGTGDGSTGGGGGTVDRKDAVQLEADCLVEAEKAWRESQLPGAAGPAGTGKPKAEEPAKPEPVAESKCVKLYGPNDPPIVSGETKPTLARARYDLVLALIKAGGNGLTKDQLATKSGHGDAVRTMKRLAKSDADWAAVLIFPEKNYSGGYRIK